MVLFSTDLYCIALFCTVISKPGQSPGLLYKHLCYSFGDGCENIFTAPPRRAIMVREDINESLQMSPGHSDRINDVSDDPCEKADSSLPLQKKETDTLNSPSKIAFTHFTSVPIIYNFECDICDKKFHLKTCLAHLNECTRRCSRPVLARCSMGFDPNPLINGLIMHTFKLNILFLEKFTVIHFD